MTYVRDQMGHSSIKVTVDTYGHLVPGGNRQAVDKLDERMKVNEENEAANANQRAVGNKKWKQIRQEDQTSWEVMPDFIKEIWRARGDSNTQPPDS